MTNQHPITTPPELVQQWISPPPELVQQWRDSSHETYPTAQFLRHVATKAAQWGADQELDACCKWFADEGYGTAPYRIRMHRRPEPPSVKGLKEQALRDLNHAYKKDQIDDITFENIQEALEALPND
jgi:hypothetical protein